MRDENSKCNRPVLVDYGIDWSTLIFNPKHVPEKSSDNDRNSILKYNTKIILKWLFQINAQPVKDFLY